MRMIIAYTGAALMLLGLGASAQTPTAPPAAGESESRSRTEQQPIDGRLIQLGEPVRDELGGERNSVDYRLTLTAGNFYDINLTSDAFDTYLIVLGPDGERLLENDDGGAGTNSRLAAIQPGASGPYTIRVTSFAGRLSADVEVQGAFTLLVEPVEIDLIGYGEQVEDELTNAGELVYTFQGAAGDLVLISAESDDFDTTLSLSSNDIDSLAYNDDGGTGTNSLLGPFELPESGLYTLTLAPFSDSDPGGTFTLLIAQARAYDAQLDTPLALTLPPDEVAAVTFEIPTTLLLNVSVRGEVAGLVLSDTFGNERASAGPTAGTPQISQVLTPQEGPYRLLLRPGAAITDAEVLLEAEPLPVLAPGETTIDFNSNNEGYATFKVEAGETVRITFTPADANNWDLSVDVLLNGVAVGYYSAFGGESFTFTHTFDEAGEVSLNLFDYTTAPVYNVSFERAPR